MARLYDTLDSRELARVALILRRGGVGYTLKTVGSGAAVQEILVAEEDFAFADLLLTGGGSTV